MRYAYYPGCYAKGTAPELDVATRAVCDVLGIGLAELTAAPCCGAGDVQQIDGPLGLALAELTLAQAEHLGLDVLTVCNVCTLTLRQAAALAEERAAGATGDIHCAAVADPACRDGAAEEEAAASGAKADPAAAVDAAVPRPGTGHLWPAAPAAAADKAADALAGHGLRYEGGVAVTHLLWVLWKRVGAARLATRVVRPLSGLRLAPFYGCQLLRPGDLNRDDVGDDPTALEDLIEACGADPVEHRARLRCCGWPVMYSRPRTAAAMAGAAVRGAADAGADAMVTPCPLCHAALEAVQADGGPQLPILHLPQVVGLALGLVPADVRLTGHAVDTRPVAARLGLTLR